MKKITSVILVACFIFCGIYVPASAGVKNESFPGDWHIPYGDDFEGYSPGGNISTQTTATVPGGWYNSALPAGSKIRYISAGDPLNPDNKVGRFWHYEDTSVGSPETTVYDYYADFGGEYDGVVNATYKIMPDSDATSFRVIFRGADREGNNRMMFEISVNYYAKGYLRITGADETGKVDISNAPYIYYAAARFPANAWSTVNITFDFNNNTASGDIDLGGNSTVTFSGVLDRRADPEARFKSVNRLQVRPIRNQPVYNIYMDDVGIYSDVGAELDAAAPQITAAAVSDEPHDALTQNLKTLPAQLEGGLFGVAWSSDNEFAVKPDSTVTRRLFTQTANLTAKIIYEPQNAYSRNANRLLNFQLTVLPSPDSAAAADGDVLDDVLLHYFTEKAFTGEPPDAVTKNLKTLPLTGPDGITFSWSSDKPEFISDTGEVTRPFGANEEVTLSVAAERNGVTRFRSFTFTVLWDYTDEEKIAMALEQITYADLTSVRPDSLTGKCVITVDLLSPLPKRGLYGAAFSWSSDKPDVITDEGKVTRQPEDTAVIMTLTAELNGEADEKEFPFTVKMTDQSMAEKDRDMLALTLPEIVTSAFSVPLVCGTYRSGIVWTSNNPAATVSGGRILINQPEFEVGDAIVTLTAAITKGTGKTVKGFTFTVPRLPSNEGLVNDALDMLTWESISLESQTGVANNLGLFTEFENGARCSWSSVPAGVITNDGEVINPAPGSPPAEVTLTAEVSKGNSYAVYTKAKSFAVTVLPFSSDEEVLGKAVDMLTFDVLSPDSIQRVKSDLFLPKAWKYGTAIEWRSENAGIIKIADDAPDCKGIINRPDYGGSVPPCKLTALVSYNGVSAEKVFSVSLEAKEKWFSMGYFNFEGTDIGQPPAGGKNPYLQISSRPAATCVSFTTEYDPVNPRNKVARYYRPAGVAPSGDNITYFSAGNDVQARTMMTYGRVNLSLRLYMGNDNDQAIGFKFRNPGSSYTYTVTFHPDGTVRYDGNVGGALDTYGTLVGAYAPLVRKGMWHDVRIEMNSHIGYAHVYVDGECMTKDGYLTYNGVPYPSPNGICNRWLDTAVRNHYISADVICGNSRSENDYVVYMDDFRFERLFEDDTEALNAMERIITELLSKNDIDDVRTDLILPALNATGFIVNYSTNNSAVVTSEGRVTRPGEDTAVLFTIKISWKDPDNLMGTQQISRSFNLTVKGKNTAPDDAELALADLSEVVAVIKAGVQLKNIISNISLPASASNGSVISYASGNPDVLTAAGKVTRPYSDEPVALTITADKNGKIYSEDLDLIVKARATVTRQSSVSSGVVSGSSTVPKSGIVIDPPVTEGPKPPAQIFADVPDDFWGAGAINVLYKKDIISKADNFRPDDNITREEFVKLLAAAVPFFADGETAEFSDVAPGEWYEIYIAKASAAGIVHGKGDGSFGIGEKITRQDMAVMLCNAAAAGGIMLKGSTPPAFADRDMIADYALSAVSALCANGILSGMEDNTFRPLEPATRAQAAAIIFRLLERL